MPDIYKELLNPSWTLAFTAIMLMENSSITMFHIQHLQGIANLL